MKRVVAQIECVRDDLDRWTVCSDDDRHDIEATGTIGHPLPREKVRGSRNDAPALRPCDGIGTRTIRGAVSCLHFDEDDRRPLLGDDVNFATAAPISSGKNRAPAAFQFATGQVFADFSKDIARTRHVREKGASRGPLVDGYRREPEV